MFASLLLSLFGGSCSLDSLPVLDSVYTMQCLTREGDTLTLYRLGPSLSDSMGYDLSYLDDDVPMIAQGVVVDGRLEWRATIGPELFTDAYLDSAWAAGLSYSMLLDAYGDEAQPVESIVGYIRHIADVCLDQDLNFQDSRGSDDVDCDNVGQEYRSFIASKWGN